MLPRRLEALAQPLVFRRFGYCIHALFHERADVLPEVFTGQFGADPQYFFALALFVGTIEGRPVQEQATHAELAAAIVLASLTRHRVVQILICHFAWSTPVHMGLHAIPIQHYVAAVACGAQHVDLAGGSVEAVAGAERGEEVGGECLRPEQVDKHRKSKNTSSP
ncbi:hypothetical protein D9M72_455710 [compost metagenome]